MVSGSMCLNHFLAVTVNVTAKHLHRAHDETWSKSIWSLKVSRWSWGSVFPSYVVMVGIQNPLGKGTCWISRLKDELVVEGVTSKLLAVSLLSLFLSSLISSCTRENAGRSFFFEDADVRLESRWARKSSSVFRLSWSNTLRDDFSVSLVCSFCCDPCGATYHSGRLNTVPL